MALTFRAGTPDDSFAAFRIFQAALVDLGQRVGGTAITGGRDSDTLETLWQRRRSQFEHLARTSDQFWLAEEDGEPIGYARSILRDGLRQLTESFVLPERQSRGLGRELLARAFPREGATHRLILGSADLSALTLYLRAGLVPLFPCFALSRPAEPVAVPTDLVITPLDAIPATLVILGDLDQAVLGHRREVDHAWLRDDRQGYLYRRDGQPVGYGYVGDDYTGPFALLAAADFPAVLAHAETQVAAHGGVFTVEVPLVNRAAVGWLLGRGARLDPFFEHTLVDVPFGHFDRYVLTSPALLL
jgi:GNAT superfamily N-acetyltransferase